MITSTTKIVNAPAVNPALNESIDNKIKEILSRGKVVVFTNRLNHVKKFLTKWNPDDMGDLEADYSTGATKFICPYCDQYDITECDVVPGN